MTDTVGKIERVERLRVSDSVAAQLVQLITKKSYAVGEKLPSERVLAEQFGVSRSSMREAIRGVEASGLVSSSHGVGVFVVSNTVHSQSPPDLLVFEDFTVPELFEVRRVLEGEAAALAAQRLTPTTGTELKSIIEQCADPDLTDEEFVTLDVELHQKIAQASGNGLLSTLYAGLEPLMQEYSRRVIALPGRREHAHKGHIKIVDAIVARQMKQARAAALAHIRDVEHDIAKRMAKPST
ncbi:GntR family transcriptional repressor for pyruvate dehydrogenase complex [Arthrobacter pigmenti]|uniref:GntR family transcriptional repressor for pyruvate dehydrogenase complex n=1 Tax=Arthrobacter pigmenti TaxID=271432 RepID=A0A846REF8_9MICC|nr:FadR/GntR family transcriptional regulator [Arthrobacter pigmenti]NJC21518.1 GntR family transcriptional repressor for pyruvate dehydrogenase complex [Arthrobacter pigmenti]